MTDSAQTNQLTPQRQDATSTTSAQHPTRDQHSPGVPSTDQPSRRDEPTRSCRTKIKSGSHLCITIRWPAPSAGEAAMAAGWSRC